MKNDQSKIWGVYFMLFVGIFLMITNSFLVELSHMDHMSDKNGFTIIGMFMYAFSALIIAIYNINLMKEKKQNE